MRVLLILFVCLMMLVCCGSAVGEDSPIFPDVKADDSSEASLGNAISTFDDILESSPEAEMEGLNSSTEYNSERIAELKKRLAERVKYLEGLDDLVSREFNTMMQRYPDADQAQLNRIANDLHEKWQSIEKRVRREIVEIKEQLDMANSRLSESTMRTRMLEISTSLSGNDGVFVPKPTDEEGQQGSQRSSAFDTLDSLSRRRTLSRISKFCAIRVRALDVEPMMFVF